MASIKEFKKMMDQAPCGMGLFFMEGDGKPYYLNHTYYQMLGYTKDEYKKKVEYDTKQLLYEEDRYLIPIITAELRLNGSTKAQYRIVRKDGIIRWVKFNASIWETEKEKYIFATFLDITRETELANNLDLFADYAECSLTVIKIQDKTTSLLYANDYFYTMIGIPKENLQQNIFSKLKALVSTEDRKRIEGAVSNVVLSGKKGQIQYKLKRPDGTVIHINRLFFVLPKSNKESYTLFSISTDVTAKVEAEEAVAFEQSRYRLILEKMNATIFEWNCKKDSFYSSKTYQNYAMSDVDYKMILQNRGPLDTVYPEDIPILKDFFKAKNDPDRKAECILHTKMKDGTFRLSRLMGIRSFDETGALARVIGVIIDLEEKPYGQGK